MNLRQIANETARVVLGKLPLDVRSRIARNCISIESGLTLLKRNGFEPTSIIDVGACDGAWSLAANNYWPTTPVIMIDGRPELKASLQRMSERIGPSARHFISLLGPEKRESVKLLQLGAGTSVLQELTGFQPTVIEVPMNRLDSLLAGESLGDRVFIKVDVQGFELEVLKGAGEIFQKAEVLILEIATIPYNQGAPLFAEVVRFMDDAGFVAYEFCGGSRRTDLAPFQIDVFFVRSDSPLRKPQRFFANEPSKPAPRVGDLVDATKH